MRCGSLLDMPAYALQFSADRIAIKTNTYLQPTATQLASCCHLCLLSLLQHSLINQHGTKRIVLLFCRFMPWPRQRTGGGVLPADTLWNAWRYSCHPFITLHFGCHYAAKALTEQVQAIVQCTLLPLGKFYLCKVVLPCLNQMGSTYRLQPQVQNHAKLCDEALASASCRDALSWPVTAAAILTSTLDSHMRMELALPICLLQNGWMIIWP